MTYVNAKLNYHLKLAATILIVGCADILLTLAGQTREYWEGDYTQVIEGNPFAKPILMSSPYAFLVLGIIWVVVIAVLAFVLDSQIAKILSLIAAFGHTFGTCCWLIRYGDAGWCAALVIMTAVVILLVSSKLKDDPVKLPS